MCGIAGIFGYGSPDEGREVLLKMAGELAHRGPDGVGLFIDTSFGMVNTRLSIIDIEGGDQPLPNEDGRFWVMQNGEIYNHVELRRRLEARGHRFSTRSDTEVLVHAYEEWGDDFLKELNGEFAVAIYDRLEGTLLIARDRFGVRPLFLARYGAEMAFASEAKALLRHPQAERRIDPLAVLETFTLWAVQPDRSAFVGIEELPPGCFLKLGNGSDGEIQRWWDIGFGPKEGALEDNVDALTEELRKLMTEATRIRLRADVPVGVYLSGGLDSSITTALAQEFASGPLEAFSLVFDDPRFDESRFQREVASSLGVNLHQVRVHDRDVADVFPDVIRLAEKPMLRTSPGPLFLLSRLVRDAGFKVVLTGEGADELLGGYQIFQEAMVRRFWARMPESRLRPRLLGRLYPYLSRDLAQGGGFMAAFFANGMEDTDDPLYSHRPRFRTTSRNVRFLSPEVRESAASAGEPEVRLIRRLPAAFWKSGPLGQAQYLEIKTFLSGYLLSSQGDRMLMGNSVEGRFPFLDHTVAEFASGLPEKLRMNGIREKYLLRKAFASQLPAAIHQRPKQPYRAPILRPFFGPLAPGYVKEMLSSERIEASGLFNGQAVARLVKKAALHADSSLSESDEMGIVGVLSTMLVKELFVDLPDLAPAAVPTKEVRYEASLGAPSIRTR